jgi:hypothetical protein
MTAGCTVQRPPRFASTGVGPGTSPDFALPSGAYEIIWSAGDGAGSPAGCLFGLVLDDDARTDDLSRIQMVLPIRKFAYESLDEGGSLQGRQSVDLAAQTYRFHVEGSCAWTVTVDDG